MAPVAMVCSTIVESPLQIDLFLQNKANFRKSQMNIKLIMTRNYEKKLNWTLGENKPNFQKTDVRQPENVCIPEERSFYENPIYLFIVVLIHFHNISSRNAGHIRHRHLRW
jgi:hypothetical protein